MKASLKFREDQRPLARAKIPISILGLPFLAGAAAGDPLDLRLDLTTAFDSGPALRVSYRPNEPFSPFTLAVKTGIGAFGSPIAAPLSMITEFNIFSSHTSSSSPSFSLLFKPRLGDFCFRKSASSSPPSRKIVPVSDGEEMFPSSPSLAPGSNGIHPGGKANGVVVDFPAARGGIGGLLSGIEVAARSVLPIRGRAMVGFRWGFRLPRTDLQSSFSADTFSVANLPMLLMNKISIEHVPAAARSKLLRDSGPNVAAGEEGTEACRSVRQDIAALQAESAVLRKAVEDLREKINGSGFSSGMMFPAIGNKDGSGAEAGKGGLRAAAPEPSKRERRSEAKSVAEDVNEELKKALMNASAAGK